ncbi:MAG: hypothetical protein VX379_10525 [Pseudomonadota bacterium]|uniref:hypothetical protein n=1 Tax=Alcanivorax sp. TaxID=1872427 RepID=UPI00243CA0A5|nr:hypothetical protein [Alcanivorax sp.]MED5240000.1 hypothetical protein [Pseudomonadota bacterium]MEE3320869.1 hypothetical protein [Pseudomonadota bacterium]
MVCPRLCLLGYLTTLTITTSAQNWHVPHPWRSEAVVTGRANDYGDEYFLHAFSYRHIQAHPSPVEEGIRGTGGSLTSDRLYLDFRYLQRFQFDNPDQAFVLDIQRGEDFDGSYDRQLVGFQQTLAQRWELSLQGDVFNAKSLSDIYFGVRRHHGNGSWLQVNWVLPNAYFNDKTDTDSEIITRPQTLFLQWHQQTSAEDSMTLSLNHSPESTLNDRAQGDQVSSEQSRLALRLRKTTADWQWQTELKGERTRRTHQLIERPQVEPFRRDMGAVSLSARYRKHPLQPMLGAHYFWLKESGWFGRSLDGTARIERREPLLFGSISWRLTRSQTLSPTVYLSWPTVQQTVTNTRWSDRDENGFIGKLSLPWQILVSREHGAVLSIVPSLRLHRLAFGGGNLQLHWPL